MTHTQVLMVIFDILASHSRMLRWHEVKVEEHLADLARLQHSKQQLELAAASHSQEEEQPGSSERKDAAAKDRQNDAATPAQQDDSHEDALDESRYLWSFVFGPASWLSNAQTYRSHRMKHLFEQLRKHGKVIGCRSAFGNGKF